MYFPEISAMAPLPFRARAGCHALRDAGITPAQLFGLALFDRLPLPARGEPEPIIHSVQRRALRQGEDMPGNPGRDVHRDRRLLRSDAAQLRVRLLATDCLAQAPASTARRGASPRWMRHLRLLDTAHGSAASSSSPLTMASSIR
jgi:hypothetical protein